MWATGGAHPKTYYSDATAVQTNAAKTDVVVADVLQARDIRKAVNYLASVSVPRVGATLGSMARTTGAPISSSPRWVLFLAS